MLICLKNVLHEELRQKILSIAFFHGFILYLKQNGPGYVKYICFKILHVSLSFILTLPMPLSI